MTANSSDLDTLLLYGYVRSLQDLFDLNTPREIIKIILTFYHLDIEGQMIWDKDTINTQNVCEIINDYKIKMIAGKFGSFDYGASAKLQYGISVNRNDYLNISSISWKIKINPTQSFPNSYYFIGVVSNRTSDFNIAAFPSSLKDAFGISASNSYIFDDTKVTDFLSLVHDMKYTRFKRNVWVKINYIITESKLVFEFENWMDVQCKYELSLPTNITGITHWYPAVSLRNKDDECEIGEIVVE